MPQNSSIKNVGLSDSSNDSQLGDVVAYIQNQEEHHSCRTFKEEYLELLKRFDVTYNEKYVFDSVDKDTSET